MEAFALESLQLLAEQFVIPAGIKSQSIVSQDVSAFLCIGEVAQYDDRYRLLRPRCARQAASRSFDRCDS